MRTPGLLVAVATAAVLTTGLVAATTAGADTTPPAAADRPGAAAPWPGWPDGAWRDSAWPAGSWPTAPPRDDAGPSNDPVPAAPSRVAKPSPAAEPSGKPADVEPTGDKPADTRPKPSPSRGDGRPGGTGIDPSAHTAMQREALRLVNDARRSHGCPPLTVDAQLVEAARGHAADMASRGYFAHRSPNGRNAGDRVSDAGYDWATYGENIARGQDSAAEVVQDWMDSPSHRENILTCAHSEVGVARAFDADHTPYWVQNLASPDRN